MEQDTFPLQIFMVKINQRKVAPSAPTPPRRVSSATPIDIPKPALIGTDDIEWLKKGFCQQVAVRKLDTRTRLPNKVPLFPLHR